MLNYVNGTFKRKRKEHMRGQPISIIIGIIMTGLGAIIMPIMVYYFVFQSETSNVFKEYVGDVNFISYITLGASSFTLIISTITSVGRSLIDELREGTLSSLLVTPLNNVSYFTSIYLEQLLRSITQFYIILLIGFIFGAEFSFSEFIFINIYIFLISLSAMSIGVFLSGIMLFTRDSFYTQNTLILILATISGVTFPIEYLPKGIQIISKMIPMTWGIAGIRNISTRNYNTSEVIIYSLVGTTIIFILGFYIVKKAQKKILNDIV